MLIEMGSAERLRHTADTTAIPELTSTSLSQATSGDGLQRGASGAGPQMRKRNIWLLEAGYTADTRPWHQEKI